jgi:hypothetical protein
VRRGEPYVVSTACLAATRSGLIAASVRSFATGDNDDDSRASQRLRLHQSGLVSSLVVAPACAYGYG